MVNRYETVFILTPVLSEDQVKETVKKVEATLKEQKAKVMHRENWGLKKLAYPIKKKSTGFYNLLEFEGEGSCIERLEIEMKRDERIIRFLTVKMDKHAMSYADQR
ncbi:MAG: 30S ribosomal protein S6, partial [Flavobacteriales bacterium]